MSVTHEQKSPDGFVDPGSNLDFLAFALSHAACGDGPVEVRVDERCLIEWCPDCAQLATFVSPRA